MFSTDHSVFFHTFLQLSVHIVNHAALFTRSLDFLQEELRLIIAPFSHINKPVGPAYGHVETI